MERQEYRLTHRAGCLGKRNRRQLLQAMRSFQWYVCFLVRLLPISIYHFFSSQGSPYGAQVPYGLCVSSSSLIVTDVVFTMQHRCQDDGFYVLCYLGRAERRRVSVFAGCLCLPSSCLQAAKAGDIEFISSQALHVVTFYYCLLPTVVLNEQEEKRAELAAYKV